MLAALDDAIRRLPGKYRRCFVLHCIDELSYDDIAVSLDMSVGTVKSYVHRARNQVEEIVGPLRDALRPPS